MKKQVSALGAVLSRLADYLTLNLLFLLTSLPMLTVGTSAIALYDTVAHCLRFGEDEITRRYFATFRRELMPGVKLTVIWAVAGFLLFMGCRIIQSNLALGGIWKIILGVYLATMLFPLGLAFWHTALESRIVYGFKQLLVNSIAVTVIHFPHTAAVALALAGALALVIWCPWLALLLPGPLAHLQSLFAEPVLLQYMLEDEVLDPDAELEQD